MRRENSVRNIKFNLIFTFLLLIINFVSRSVFISFLGDDIAGLNTLIMNLMSFLNVTELGVAVAITYSLYEPLNRKDYKKINEIMILFKYYYLRISFIIFILGIVLGILLPVFIKDQIPINNAYIYYGLFLINTIISYFFVYKQTLIIADQKQYIVVCITNTVKILKTIMQLLLLYITSSYLIWIVIEIISNIINFVLINLKTKELYPEVTFEKEASIKSIKRENCEIIKSIKDVFCHKIASFIVYQTDGILISLFLSLRDTAIYGNYSMVINGVLSIFNSIIGSFTASVGSLISEKNDEKSFDIFKSLYTIDHFMAIIISFTLFYIIDPFIDIWIGNGYTFNKLITFILMINIYIQVARGTIENFKSAYGLFWDVWSPVVEGVINFIISVILVKRIGILGLFIGTMISNIIIVLVWKPYMVYKYGFKIEIFEHIKLFIVLITKAIIAFIIGNCIKQLIFSIISIENYNFITFLIYSAIVFLSITISTFCVFIINRNFRSIILSIIRSNRIFKSKKEIY